MSSFKSMTNAVDNFFFEPKPTEGIAVFRIVWISLLIFSYFCDIQNIEDFYGPDAIISLKTVKEHFPFPHMNIFHWLGNTLEMTQLIFMVYGLALFASLIGFYTRPSLIIVLICMTSLHQRNIWLLSSMELLCRVITIFLACSPCGHSLSVDSILGRKYSSFKQEKMWAPWALRMIQIQIAVLYVWTVWQKLQGSDWFDGSAVYYATRLDNMKNFPVPFILDSVLMLKLLTWGTLLVELALGILIWFDEFRKPLIYIGIIFHLGIDYIMSIPFFELTMMALLINYFTPEEYKTFVERLQQRCVKLLESSNMVAEVKEKIIWAVKPS
ncbi:MAG: HTTM domain-containing protein [Bacteriovoracaceae bacterium]